MDSQMADESFLFDGEGELVEVAFLLTNEQTRALEKAAHQRGLTTAQMLRCLIGHFLDTGKCLRESTASTSKRETVLHPRVDGLSGHASGFNSGYPEAIVGR
jgi:hypothetical protein